MIVLGECLYSYRVHLASVTKRDPRVREQMVASVRRRACERRGLDYARLFGDGDLVVTRATRADNNVAAHFIESAVDQARAGQRLNAMRTGMKCARLAPLDPHYHKAWVLAATPLFMHRYLRRSIAAV